MSISCSHLFSGLPSFLRGPLIILRDKLIFSAVLPQRFACKIGLGIVIYNAWANSAQVYGQIFTDLVPDRWFWLTQQGT